MIISVHLTFDLGFAYHKCLYCAVCGHPWSRLPPHSLIWSHLPRHASAVAGARCHNFFPRFK